MLLKKAQPASQPARGLSHDLHMATDQRRRICAAQPPTDISISVAQLIKLLAGPVQRVACNTQTEQPALGHGPYAGCTYHLKTCNPRHLAAQLL